MTARLTIVLPSGLTCETSFDEAQRWTLADLLKNYPCMVPTRPDGTLHEDTTQTLDTLNGQTIVFHEWTSDLRAKYPRMHAGMLRTLRDHFINCYHDERLSEHQRECALKINERLWLF